MKSALPLGSVAGIKISIHWTFLILIGWIVFSHLTRGESGQAVLWSVVFVLTLFGCVTLHELGHALAAKRFGIKTRSITLLPIGGVAQLESMPEKPRQELVVALAGPAVNVLIATLLLLVTGWPDPGALLAGLDRIGPGNFGSALLFVNLSLAGFNLIPAFPLDGGRVFRAILSFRLPRERATRMAANLGKILAMGFVLLGLFYNPFLVFIGFFIFIGAEAEAQQTEAQALLRGFTVRDARLKKVPFLAAEAPLREAADLLLQSQNTYFLVRDGKLVFGVIGRDEIIRALDHYGEETPVRQALNRELLCLPPDMPLEAAWRKMQEHNQDFALIGTGQQALGAVDLENITEFVLIRSAGQHKMKNA